MRIRRSGAALTAAFIGTSATNYAFGLVMARLLLPGDFGVLAFAQTVLLISGLMLETGVPWSLAKELAVTKNPDTRAALIRGAALSNLALSMVIGLGLIVLYVLGPLRVGMESWPVMAAVAVSLPLMSLVGVTRGASQGLERFGVLAIVQVVEVFGKACASTAMVLLGYGVFGAVAGFAVGALFAALYGLRFLLRIPRVVVLKNAVNIGMRAASPMFAAFLGSALLLNLDLMALKIFAPSDRAAAGHYQAGIILANAPFFLVSSVILPMSFSRLATRENLRSTSDIVVLAIKLTALVVVPMEMFLMVEPAQVLGFMFPSDYEAGASALRLRALGVGVFVIATVVATAYQAVGRASFVAYVFLGACVVELSLLGFFAKYSATGVAVTFAGTAVAVTTVLGLDYMRQLNMINWSRSLSWMVRYSCAVIAAAALYWMASSLSFGLLARLGLVGVGYAGLVLFLRLLPKPPESLLRKAATTSTSQM